MFALKLLRLSLILLTFPITALLSTSVSLFRPFNPDNARLGGRIFSWLPLKIMGVNYTVEGTENVADMKPSIVVANHQDNMDLFVCGPSVPKRTVVIGKSSLKYFPFFGQAFWLSGSIMINRSKQTKSISVLEQITEAIHHDQKSVWVFPEGTRSLGKGLQAFKKGAFHMALGAKIPIVPICVSSYITHIDLSKWRSGSVLVKILPPIDTSQYDENTLPELMEKTRALMERTIVELDARVEQLDK